MPVNEFHKPVVPHLKNEFPVIERLKHLIVLVPIYRPQMDPLEQYSLDVSLSILVERNIRFIGPKGMDFSLYATRYPTVPIIGFDDNIFSSIQAYNRLLLNTQFYQIFSDFEFMLILQTDAIILRDELDYWCGQPFDYIGAPWPDGLELFVNLGRFEGNNGRKVRAMVGNGGLSLRRIRKCIPLLNEFPEAIDFFNRSGSSEDLFFSFMGQLSSDFVIPNEITASMFSLELKPSNYVAVNGGELPMGGHAWWKHEPEFWRKLLNDAPPLPTT